MTDRMVNEMQRNYRSVGQQSSLRKQHVQQPGVKVDEARLYMTHNNVQSNVPGPDTSYFILYPVH